MDLYGVVTNTALYCHVLVDRPTLKPLAEKSSGESIVALGTVRDHQKDGCVITSWI